MSGSNSGIALKSMTGLETLPKPRMAILKTIKNPANGEIIDKGLILWFPSKLVLGHFKQILLSTL